MLLRRKTAAAFLALCGGVLVALVHCSSDATQLVVVVYTDLQPNDLDAITVDVDSSDSHQVRQSSIGEGGISFPVTLGVLPGADTSAVVNFTVSATLDGTAVVTRQVQAAFVPNTSRTVVVMLCAGCRSVVCSSGQSCGETGCTSIDLSDLPPWTGTAPVAPACGMGPADSGPLADGLLPDGPAAGDGSTDHEGGPPLEGGGDASEAGPDGDSGASDVTEEDVSGCTVTQGVTATDVSPVSGNVCGAVSNALVVDGKFFGLDYCGNAGSFGNPSQTEASCVAVDFGAVRTIQYAAITMEATAQACSSCPACSPSLGCSTTADVYYSVDGTSWTYRGIALPMGLGEYDRDIGASARYLAVCRSGFFSDPQHDSDLNIDAIEACY